MYNFTRLEVIRKFDRSNMLDLLVGLPAQCRKALELSRRVKPEKSFSRVNKIIVSGMGGSAVSGDILRSFLSARISLPIMVNRDYTIPRWVDRETLFFANSYSGNTEETLSAFTQARAQGARIIGVTSGGRLSEFCQRYGLPLYKLPGGQPPRTAIGYLFFPLLQALLSLGLVKNVEKQIEEAVSYLEKKVRVYQPGSAKDNLVYKLSRKIFGSTPIIYGCGEITGVAAFRWKTQFNENSKILAFNHIFPELDHNEIMGWEGPQSITKKFMVLVLKDRDESSRMKKRINITLEVIGKRPLAIEEIVSEGGFGLTRMFSLILLGDFLSFYLAIARGVDPTLIKGINTLKERLAKP